MNDIQSVVTLKRSTCLVVSPEHNRGTVSPGWLRVDPLLRTKSGVSKLHRPNSKLGVFYPTFQLSGVVYDITGNQTVARRVTGSVLIIMSWSHSWLHNRWVVERKELLTEGKKLLDGKNRTLWTHPWLFESTIMLQFRRREWTTGRRC